MNPEKQEEQRISLCIDKESGRKRFEGVYCTDYLTAITNTMFDHAKQLSDKKFQQHFFQNFTEYLSPEIKGWVLWDDFQKVSRKFEELKLENIYNNLNLTFDGTSQLSEKERVNDYLYDLRGQIAVEVAKTNPRINLYLYYDPEYANARDEMGSAIGAGDLMTLVANWSNDVASVERQVANGGEESYPSHTLRYVYHNKEELAGRVYLYGEGHDNSIVMYDLKGKLTNIMPWERDKDLAVTWKEECRITNLTLDPAYAANHLQQSSTVRQNSGEEKDIKEFADKNPVFENELREGEEKNIPSTPDASASDCKSSQLKDLASRHNHQSLSDIMQAANIQHKENNQSNYWKQDSPTKQNVSTNTQKEISLIKAESWADSNESKRVGQLIKTWETPSQTTSATTLDSRKQGLGQLLEDVTTRKSYPSGDKKQVIPNKALSLSKTQPHLEF